MYVFIDKFFTNYFKSENRKKYIIKYIKKYAVFGIISMGIGLSYSLKNLIEFEQSIFYVPIPSKMLFCGDNNLFARLNIFSKEWARVFCDPFKDCNIIAYIVKCSLFGEFSVVHTNTLIERILMILNIVIILISIMIIMNIFKKKLYKANKILKMFIVFYITEIIMFLYANFSMPYGCTMDFRYIVPTIFTGMIFIITNLKQEDLNFYKTVRSLVALFLFFSVVFELTDMRFLII